MNYLAHALLSPEDPLILMGNLWGDLLKPRDYDLLPQGILEGVRRHKKIDAFTDQHPAVEEMVRWLRPHQGKYTPVVADVLMDYILSKFWNKYQHDQIDVFCRAKYETVESHLSYMPQQLHPRIKRMLEHRWLESCTTRGQMQRTLNMLSKRAAFANTIPDAMDSYDLYEDRMDVLFLTFFDDMQRFITLQNEG